MLVFDQSGYFIAVDGEIFFNYTKLLRGSASLLGYDADLEVEYKGKKYELLTIEKGTRLMRLISLRTYEGCIQSEVMMTNIMKYLNIFRSIISPKPIEEVQKKVDEYHVYVVSITFNGTTLYKYDVATNIHKRFRHARILLDINIDADLAILIKRAIKKYMRKRKLLTWAMKMPGVFRTNNIERELAEIRNISTTQNLLTTHKP